MASILFGLSIPFIIFIYYRVCMRPRFKLPPCPRPWPVVGNLLQMDPVLCRSFAELSWAYGPIASVWLGSMLNVIVSSSALAKEVLKHKDLQLSDRPRNVVVARLTKDGKDLTWADYGPDYVKLKKVCTLELFSAKTIKALGPIREDEINTMVESIFKDSTNANENDTNGSLLLRNYLQEVAFNSITRMLFGKRLMGPDGQVNKQVLELKEFVADQLRLSASVGILEHIPWLRWILWFYKGEFDSLISRRERLFRAIMEEQTLANEKNPGAGEHFLSELLSQKKRYDLSEDNIIGLMWDMITAGTDTNAISVEWAMAQVIKNHRVQKKAQEELDRVIGSDRVMIESDLTNLPYLQCLAKEALRLHPPTPLMLPHQATTNVKIGGYDIPAGSIVTVNVWAIARDPTIWKDPLEFRPERFLEENIDIKGHDFRVLPFGSGRRVCPGAQLGINLVTSMLGHLLHHFDWTLPKGVKEDEIHMVETSGLVSYMRTPLQVVASPRLPSHLYTKCVEVGSGSFSGKMDIFPSERQSSSR